MRYFYYILQFKNDLRFRYSEHIGQALLQPFWIEDQFLQVCDIVTCFQQQMIKKMNGDCTVEQTDSVFEITLLFPKQ